jgi:hypothetical protein
MGFNKELTSRLVAKQDPLITSSFFAGFGGFA